MGYTECDAYGNMHLIWRDSKSAFLITHSHLVAWRDIVNSWFSVTLYALALPDKYPGYHLPTEIQTLIEAGTELVCFYHQHAYDLLKMWPSLVIGSILADREDKPKFKSELLKNCESYRNTKMFRLMTRTIESDVTVMMALELTGLWKCFGHPNVDMDNSVKSWVEKGSVMKPEVAQIAPLLLWTFRLEFCRQYYRDKHRWPAAHIHSDAPEKIHWNYRNNMWNERPSAPWRPEDFQHVHLQHTLTFDYHVDITDLLSDKSIIPEKAQWIHEYDKQAYRTTYGHFPRGPPPTSKSVILDFLSKEEVNVKEIIDLIQEGRVPEAWKILVAMAKEREFKWKNVRFYGKLTPEMRLYQTATESNLATRVFPFIKHQSMTMSEEQLTRTILKMNTPILKLEGETYVFIVVDFSSWCTTFRWELLWPLFSEIDSLFGFKEVYTYTHAFPPQSHLIFQDRFCPPQQHSDTGNPMEGPRCYPSPEAWLEGLRQKGWTLATILLILLSSWVCGTSASLLGQGDNQVILLRVPPEPRLKQLKMTQDEYITMYLTTLKSYCEKAGIIIKLEETWHSRDLFEYSRKYHYKGAQVSAALKRISRLASEANQTLPTLNGDLSGFFSTGAAAAAEDCTPSAAYYCTIVEACNLLWDSSRWLKEHPLSDTVCLLLLTRTLGGYPIIIYSQFCTRAVQDVLTSNLHLVRTTLQDPFLRDSMARLVCLKLSKTDDPLSLIKDPQSLPLDIPRQPENYVRGEIKRGLPSIIVNRSVKRFFSSDTTAAANVSVVARRQFVHNTIARVAGGGSTN